MGKNNKISFIAFFIIISIILCIISLYYESNNVVIFSLIIIIGFIILGSGFNFNCILNNPAVLFFVGWMFPLALSQLRLSYFQDEFSSNTWQLLIFTTIAFCIPMFITQLLIRKKNKLKSERKNLIYYDISILYKPIIFIAVILFFIVLINWILIGGIPLIVGERTVSHLDTAKGFSYFILMIPLISGISLFYNMSGGKKYRKAMWLIVLMPYVYSILQMLRSYMLFAIYYQVSFLYLSFLIKNNANYKLKYSYNKIIKFFIITMSILIILMPILGQFRMKDLGADYTNKQYYWSERIGFKYNNETLSWIYSYYVMGFDNLNLFVNNYAGISTHYYNSLLPIIGPLQLKQHWYYDYEAYKYIINNVPVIWDGAVGTYLRELFMDGGLLYCIIFVLIFSFITDLIFYKSIINEIKISWFSAYIVLGVSIMYMFFNSGALLSTSTFINLLLAYYITKKYTKSIKYNN